MTAIPLHHGRMLRVINVSHRLKKISVTRPTADIFWRALISTANTIWNLRGGPDRQHYFDFDPMSLTVTKFIQVMKRLSSLQCPDHSLAGLWVHRRGPAIGIRNSVILAGNFKLMQVPFFPTHRNLDHRVKSAQGDRFWHHHTTPDGGFDPFQFDVQ